MVNHRNEFVDLIEELGLVGVGVELGVRHGDFTEVLAKSRLSFLVGIDHWGERWNVADYRFAFNRLVFSGNVHLARMTFDEASWLFNDCSLDFIYIDGDASEKPTARLHTFHTWWPKLRVGGIIAGHDYCEDWPNVVEAVDLFSKQYSVDISYTSEEVKQPVKRRRRRKEPDDWGRYPSWYAIK